MICTALLQQQNVHLSNIYKQIMEGVQELSCQYPELRNPEQVMKMNEDEFPKTIKFETQLYFFEFEWTNPKLLLLEAFQKSQELVSYEGIMCQKDNVYNYSFSEIFNYLRQLIRLTKQEQLDYLSTAVRIQRDIIMDDGQYSLSINLLDSTDKTYYIPLKRKIAYINQSTETRMMNINYQMKEQIYSHSVEYLFAKMKVNDSDSQSEHEIFNKRRIKEIKAHKIRKDLQEAEKRNKRRSIVSLMSSDRLKKRDRKKLKKSKRAI